jgi:hypothetical protein
MRMTLVQGNSLVVVGIDVGEERRSEMLEWI